MSFYLCAEPPTSPCLEQPSHKGCLSHKQKALDVYKRQFEGRLRNTTLLFDRQGREAGAYFKQHLFPTEPAKKLVDAGYTQKEREPTMVDVYKRQVQGSAPNRPPRSLREWGSIPISRTVSPMNMA